MENDTRVIKAIAYIDSAERHMLYKNRGYMKAWTRKEVLFSLRNARTLLHNIKSENKEDRDYSRLFVEIQRVMERMKR